MDLKIETFDFFGLVTELCKTLVGKRRMEYPNRRDDSLIVNEMRIIAFEILLNKHGSHNMSDNQEIEASDPVAELLKYCFILKTTAKSLSSATKLENVLNHLMDVDGNYDSSLKSSLIFLHHLKNYQSPKDNRLDVFDIDVMHPESPETNQWHKEVPQYQIYPLSALELPIKICELNTTHFQFGTSNLETPLRRLFQLPSESIHNEFPIPAPLTPYDLNVKENEGEEYYKSCGEYIAESPWNGDKIELNNNHSDEFSFVPTISDILPSSNCNSSYEIDHHTWETLGDVVTSAPSSFASESTKAIEYFENSRHLSHSGEIFKCRNEQHIVITIDKFIENSKFVLLGIDSSCYVWSNALGFTFDINTTVSGLNRESLQSICSDITRWATCFRLLSLLVHPNPKSNELRPDDLIFKAMCNNIDDILIHYQAVILQVFSQNNSSRLLNLLDHLRDIGVFISEVARLCRCDQIFQTTVGEGTGILSHIYNEVTKVTKPKIALVFYSVLKSCCEVYFQLLEKWIFEGICDEAYGEFMININGHYLRNRGHKFWTRCFGINNEAVPGFLKNLTDSILQCGKAVRLLKICDSKNPICHLFTAQRPTVKVCLNMVMLSEQEKICSKYMADGEVILGSNVTLSAAFREMKAVEKKKADRVIAAQHYTLERIKRNFTEMKLQLAQGKRELLADQKKQCEDAVSRREIAKEVTLMEDKLLMEQQVIEDEKLKNIQLAEAKVTLEYYKDLANEAIKRRLRATWRAKRMALYDERMMAISIARSDETHPVNHEQSNECFGNLVADNVIRENDITLIYLDSERQDANASTAPNDENCNSSSPEIIQQQIISMSELNKTDRPLILDVVRKNIRGFENETIDSSSTNTVRSQTGVILNGIIEMNHLFQESHTQDFQNIIENSTDMYDTRDDNHTVISNARIEVVFDDNNCNMLADDEKDDNGRTVVDNINRPTDLNGAPVNATEQLQFSQPAGNDMKDSTPMSCTTDSYVPSAMGSSFLYNCNEASSISESRNEFETPTTPSDCLMINTMKHEFSIDNIFTSNTQCFNPFSLDNSSPAVFESSLTKADVEIIDNTSLQVYLEKSVLIPLRVQSQLANSAVVKCLLHDHKMLLHLQSLRSFFFLLNGEFAKNLTGPLYTKFYEIALPVELFNSHTLTNILKNALHCSLSSSYINSEFLSLTAFESPSILQILDPQALNCLCLHYKVSWPLNIIIDEALMQQYSKVFKFLLMVGRVLWVLQDDFCILKREREAAKSYQYHRVQLFRHAMMQFMTALHNYITCSVLHASWTEFEKELETARTLDQIYTTHVSYIKKILSRCMLTNRGEKLRICLRNIFEIILKFHNCLRSYEWIADPSGYVHPNYKKIEQMYDAFCILRTYPAQVVDRSASSGYQMHLSHFVDALNINPLFNL